MPGYDFDLFVIGGGSGGVRAARLAAGYGARVAVAEEHRIGGTCVIRGCIPKKLLAYAAHYAADIEDAAGFGWRIEGAHFDWPTLIANKDCEIDRLNGIYKKLLADAGVTMIEGRAVLADPHTIAIAGRRLTAARVLIAVGAWPEVPDEMAAHAITSNEAFHLPALPRRVVIVGGGFVAVEFASIFNGLGSTVVQLYRGEKILRGFDDDVRQTLAVELIKTGIDLRLNSTIRAVEKSSAGLLLDLADGTRLETDVLLCATGRRPKTAGLGLSEAGVTLDDRGAVIVDAYSCSNVGHIHAIGDCTDRRNLTPVAIREGAAFADTVFGGRPTPVDHATVPMAVFSQPPVACVGLTQAEAHALHGAVDIYRSTFRPMKHTLSGRDERTMMKLVVERTGGRVLGAHMVGADAPEIIQGLAIAVKLGATKEDFDRTVAIHPTAAEEFVLMRGAVP